MLFIEKIRLTWPLSSRIPYMLLDNKMNLIENRTSRMALVLGMALLSLLINDVEAQGATHKKPAAAAGQEAQHSMPMQH